MCTFSQLDFQIWRQSSFQNSGSVFWNTDSKWYLFCYNILNKLIDYFFQTVLDLQSGLWNGKYRDFPIYHSPLPSFPKLWTSCICEVCLLQIMSQYWYIVINESLVFIRFVLCVVYSVGFDQYLMTCIHHYSTVWHSSLP